MQVSVDEVVKAAIKLPKKPKEVSLLLTYSPWSVSSSHLKAIKQCLRTNDVNIVAEAARYLLLDLQHRDPIIRWRCLSIIDYVFSRSQQFRDCICKEVRSVAIAGDLLQSPTESSSKNKKTNSSSSSCRYLFHWFPPSPSCSIYTTEPNSLCDRFPPSILSASTTARNMRKVTEKVKELIEVWDLQYGTYYPVLRALARYLRESLKLKMPNLLQTAQLQISRQRTLETNRNVVRMQKRDIVLRDAHKDLPSMEDDVKKMEHYFEVLFPDVENMLPSIQPLGESVERPIQIQLKNRIRSDKNGTTNDDSDEKEDKKRMDMQAHEARKKRKYYEERKKEKEEDDSDDDIEWEDDPPVKGHFLPFDPQNLTATLSSAPLVLDPTPTASSIATSGENKDIIIMMRSHADYLSNVVQRKLATWQDILIDSLNHIDEDNDSTVRASRALLRKVALLGMSLHSLLTGRCKEFFEESEGIA